jgi:hypothetical protein
MEGKGKEKLARVQLIVAALENNLPEVRRLLSVGADVDAKISPYGFTPLSDASCII